VAASPTGAGLNAPVTHFPETNMNRRHWLLCLATGSLLKTAEGAGLAPAPTLQALEAAATEASFDVTILKFHFQRRWVDQPDTPWFGAKPEYRWAAFNPHNGDIIVADEETTAKWNAELRRECSIYRHDDGWSKPIENLEKVKWCTRTVIVHPDAWKDQAP
jgi:hypothetical protein